MNNNIQRSFSVKNRNFHPEETPQSNDILLIKFIRLKIPNKKPTKDKVNELIKLNEQIKKEMLKVKFCLLCKRKFQSMKYLIEHEENSEVYKKIKQ